MNRLVSTAVWLMLVNCGSALRRISRGNADSTLLAAKPSPDCPVSSDRSRR